MKVAIFIATMTVTAIASAQVDHCIGVKPDKARLACFDKAMIKAAIAVADALPPPKVEALPPGVVFKRGKWHVNEKLDAMTDKKSCTALYQNEWKIQGTATNFYVGYRGRGGVKGYTLRIDDAPADNMQLATKMEKDVSAAILEDHLARLYTAKRLRIQTLTILDSVVVDDIDLNGFKEAVDYIKEKC